MSTAVEAAITPVSGVDYDAQPVNPGTGGLIPGADADDTKSPYTIDMTASLEATDGTTRSLGTALAEIDANTAKTANISKDGSSVTEALDLADGTVSTATGEDKGLGDIIVALQKDVATATTKVAKLSDDGSEYTGDVTGATGGVTAQAAPADLTDAPTASDFNRLISLLKAAGVLK